MRFWQMLKIVPSNQFKKDLKLAKKQNKDLDKLFEVVNILADGGTLDAKYRDHDLSGNYKGTRECHIEADWLLVYEILYIGIERFLLDKNAIGM